jgi:hypothetical protein
VLEGHFVKNRLYGKGRQIVYADEELTKVVQIAIGEFQDNSVHGFCRIESMEQTVYNDKSDTDKI